MAILQEETMEMSSQTFEKTIDQDALQMMMDILQKNQYINPQRSAIREVASNAVDAIKEREVAKSILTGKSKVEDHYLIRTEGVFKDSVFVPEYYDLNWLSDLNEVHIIYRNNGTAERDEMIIRDFGVGLWGPRLRGYFNIGYSTKRNSKFALGKFGIGAKSALATGAPFFTVVTRYNGKKTAFNVYAGNIEPITPRFNLETGKPNSSFEMQAGRDRTMTVYYEDCDEKNGVDIVLQTKKHHKTQYLDAVKSQLMYFPEVRFMEYMADGTCINHDTKAEVLYEDDVMIISNNAFHNRPHLLIDKVNYGNINFEELEMEPRSGNIGIKLRSEEVSVNPTRESVIWDDTTKQAILDGFNKVVDNASKLVEKELTETDLLKWYRACSALTFGYKGDNHVLHAMSRVVELHRMNPTFKGKEGLKWSFPFRLLMRCSVVTTSKATKGSKYVYKLNRDIANTSDLFGARPMIRRKDGTESDARKNKYISRILYPQGYIEVVLPALSKPLEGGDIPATKYDYLISTVYREAMLESVCRNKKEVDAVRMDMVKASKTLSSEQMEVLRKLRREINERMHDVATYIIDEFYTHADLIDYDSIAVPEDFKAADKEDIEEEVAETAQKDQELQNMIRVSEEERRKLEGVILAHMVDKCDHTVGNRTAGNGRLVPSHVSFSRTEFKPAVVNDWTMEEVYFSTAVDQELVAMAAEISNPKRVYYKYNDEKVSGKFPMSESKAREKWLNGLTRCGYTEWGTTLMLNDEVRFVVVAQERAKYFNDFRHVRQFFMDITNKTLTMSRQLVNWNTARLLHPHLDQLSFLRYADALNPELAKWFRELEGWVKETYQPPVSDRYGWTREKVDDLSKYLDNVGTLQLYVRDNPEDTEGIATLARQLLNPAPGTEIEDARAIDLSVYDRFMSILDMCRPVTTLLNAIGWLTDSQVTRNGARWNNELEQEVRLYIQGKGAEALLTYTIEQ